MADGVLGTAFTDRRARWRSILDARPLRSYVFWLGDLNYRMKVPSEEIKSKLEKNQRADLLKYDQVRAGVTRRARRACCRPDG